MAETKLEQILLDSVSKLGFEQFKPEQKKAVMAFMQSNNVFIILSTGYGKSERYLHQ